MDERPDDGRTDKVICDGFFKKNRFFLYLIPGLWLVVIQKVNIVMKDLSSGPHTWMVLKSQREFQHKN